MRRARKTIREGEHQWIVTDDGSLTLMSCDFGEPYHSESGAVSESQHVFVELSGAARRLRLPCQNHALPLRILEIGFGSGLNFLLTADASGTSGGSLIYHAVDFFPLPPAVFRRLNYAHYLQEPAWTVCVEELLKVFHADPTRYVSEVHLGRKALRFLRCDAVTMPLVPAHYEIIYLDAFSPTVNGQLWTVSFLRRLCHALRPNGCLVTYCVRRSVQDALNDAGFSVEKHAGPVGGKREVLRARRLD